LHLHRIFRVSVTGLPFAAIGSRTPENRCGTDPANRHIKRRWCNLEAEKAIAFAMD
jgi:hypothetical protein